MTKTSLLVTATLLAGPAWPQGHDCPMKAAAAARPPEGASPYAGQEQRRLKALSEEEVQGYLEGRGMGLARPAELSHYPGPRHVLDLAAQLELAPEQQQRTRAAFERMQAEAVVRGAALVEAERRLEEFFAAGGGDAGRLRELVEAAARAQGELRDTHLRAHLETRAILTEGQVARYDALRGYGGAEAPAHGPH